MKNPAGAPRLCVDTPRHLAGTVEDADLSNTPFTPGRLLGNVATPAFHIIAPSLFSALKIGVHVRSNPILNELQSFWVNIMRLEQGLTAVFGELNDRHKN